MSGLRDLIEHQAAEREAYLFLRGWKRCESPPFARDQQFYTHNESAAMYGITGALQEQLEREQESTR